MRPVVAANIPLTTYVADGSVSLRGQASPNAGLLFVASEVAVRHNAAEPARLVLYTRDSGSFFIFQFY